MSADKSPRSKSADRLDDFASDLAKTLIEQMQQGTAPWQKPWTTARTSFLPHNPLSGSEYSGVNLLKLLSVQQERQYPDARWMTYKQIEEKGGHVKRGEHGTKCIYWVEKYLRKDGTTLEKPEGTTIDKKNDLEDGLTRLLLPKVFTVFNYAQTEGLDLPAKVPVKTPEWSPDERAERILKNSGALIRHIAGDRAYYAPASDSITLPLKAQFPSASAYYDTALHELGHWTGHSTRLNRDMSGSFGTASYAREELNAEISSMMTSIKLGLPHNTERHAAYTNSWIKLLSEDPKEIIRACANAQKISQYVMNFERSRYYVLDFDRDAVVRLSEDELISGARKKIGQNPTALQEFDRLAASMVTKENKTVPEASLKMINNWINPLNAAFTRAETVFSKNVSVDTAGIFFSTKAEEVIAAAGFRSGPLFEKTCRFIAKYEGEEIAKAAKEAAWKRIRDPNETQKLNSEVNWKYLENSRAKKPQQDTLSRLTALAIMAKTVPEDRRRFLELAGFRVKEAVATAQSQSLRCNLSDPKLQMDLSFG